MKRFTLLLSAMLLAWATNLWAAQYKLVTSTDDLEKGANYIIGSAATGSAVFMSTASNTNNRKQSSSVTITDSEITLADDILVLELGGSTGSWTFATTNYAGTAGYLNATNTTKNNYLQVKATDDAYNKFSISFSDNAAVITCTGKTSRNIMRYNSATNSGQLFSCYTSGQSAIYLFKEVSSAALISLELAGNPTKTEYMEGDAFNTDGLKVLGNYDDDTQKEITEGITWEITPESLTEGQTEVEVKAIVGDLSVTRTIEGLTVTAAKTLVSIAVSGTPAEFWKGDTFNHDGMTVTATWNDATTTDVTAEADFSEPDMTTAGIKTITVTYKEQTATYDITVKTIANTEETAYTVAEAIALIDAGKDLSTEVFVKGIVSEIVTAWSDAYNNITYNISDDGTTDSDQFQLFRCVTNGANIGDKVTAKGVMTKYNSTYEFTAGNTIVAIAEKVLTGIAISGEATKTAYYAGQTFNPAGLVVTATYEDETTEDVTELVDWTFDPAVLEEGTTMVSVSATYKEIDAAPVVVTVSVSAAKTLVSIAVSGTPAEFWKGDTFNHDGMTVTATWNDATTTDVTAEADFSEPDMTTAGTKTITVTYKEQTATYDITVKTIANTEETAYTVAEAIALIDAGKDLSTEVFVKGIVSEIVTAWSDTYNNITYNISDDGATDSNQFQLFRCATNGANIGDKVTAKGVMTKYNSTYEFTAGNTIVAIVEKVLTGIAISGEATKTAYYAGQTFNPAGLVVTATYEDETTEDVTELVEWTFDPAVLEEGTTTVSVSATYKEIDAAPVAVIVTVTAAPATKTLTIDLSKDETTTATADKLEWAGTVVTVTATKGTSTNANNYYPGTSGKTYTSTRFYTGATLSFTPKDGITLVSITYTAMTEGYTTAMVNSTWTNAEASYSGTTVTITPEDGTKAVSATIGATTGGTSFVINYFGGATPTAAIRTEVVPQTIKTIEKGQLVILRDGVKYNAMGVRLQ